MDALEIRGLEYPGDDAWLAFVKSFKSDEKAVLREQFMTDEIQTALLQILGSTDLVELWITKPIDALDGYSPYRVYRSEPGGEFIIRSLIMRLPI